MKESQILMNCDPVTGACLLAEVEEAVDVPPVQSLDWTVRYIGDPMCSWCWGISPTVSAVQAFCEAQGLGFSITMGGLRVGGGDPWNAVFKDFLRNEWRHIGEATGQPFGFTLLEEPYFDYDTEPSCRAVAAVKLLQTRNNLPSSTPLTFFSAVQRKFYVDGEDPKVADFYTSICASIGLDADEFLAVFGSPEAREAVRQEFVRCRQWGVRSFPTLLLERDGETKPLAAGFVSTEQVLSRLTLEIAGRDDVSVP